MASADNANAAPPASLPPPLAPQKYQGVERTGAGFLLLQRMGWREGQGLVSFLLLDAGKKLTEGKKKKRRRRLCFFFLVRHRRRRCRRRERKKALTPPLLLVFREHFEKNAGSFGSGHQGARPRQEEVGRLGRRAGEWF